MIFFVVAGAARLEERGWFVVVVLANDDWLEDTAENVFFYC